MCGIFAILSLDTPADVLRDWIEDHRPERTERLCQLARQYGERIYCFAEDYSAYCYEVNRDLNNFLRGWRDLEGKAWVDLCQITAYGLGSGFAEDTGIWDGIPRDLAAPDLPD